MQHNESKRLAIIKEVPKKDSDFIFKAVSRAHSNVEILVKHDRDDKMDKLFKPNLKLI